MLPNINLHYTYARTNNPNFTPNEIKIPVTLIVCNYLALHASPTHDIYLNIHISLLLLITLITFKHFNKEM